MENLLEIRDLSVVFSTDEGELKAALGVSFSMKPGERLGLVGESGCGKSVTALSILRLIPSPPGRIVSGSIFFQGRDLLSLGYDEMRKIRGNDISMIFQEPQAALSPLHRVGDQLVEAVRFHRDVGRKEAWEQAASWLAKVGISDPDQRMYAYPFQLSGGMQQRVMIAMALMMSPRLLVADEPTTALDVTTQAQIFSLVKNMMAGDMSLLLITHDMGVVWEMCDRVAVMYASMLVETGTRDQIFSAPRHPYTQGLLEAVPRLSRRKQRLSDIPGQVPSPLDYPAGCHFAGRCPRVMPVCRKAKPTLVEIDTESSVACFLYSGVEDS